MTIKAVFKGVVPVLIGLAVYEFGKPFIQKVVGK